MTERGILMAGEMAQACHEGRKTQTRRVVKPQPPESFTRHCWYNEPVYGWTSSGPPAKTWHTVRCPYGQPGDLLYVRETWRAGHMEGEICYLADGSVSQFLHQEAEEWFTRDYRRPHKHTKHNTRCRPSTQLPKWAARTWLEITDVRVERVQEITQADAVAEGWHDTCAVWGDELTDQCLAGPRGGFVSSWDSIYANQGLGWKVNPWVFALTFRRIEHG